ncbi:DUF927 domain-containing protein [Scandinavium sp. NPDC088450]|uniref:DUF927 domain-containing protein n=1 Tax=Scandinavium sp. NPDC088450 TaxID=3364514 RepID=UPI00384C2693
MSVLDDVKHWLRNPSNLTAACAAFNIPCDASGKHHSCPICGKRKFRFQATGTRAGKYICTCGSAGIGFGFIDLIARLYFDAPKDGRPSGALAYRAASLIDERMGTGFKTSQPQSHAISPQEREAYRQKQQDAYEQQTKEAHAIEASRIAEAAPRIREILTQAIIGECLYLKGKGYSECQLPLTANGWGVLLITDIDNRERSLQYLPPPGAVSRRGELHTKIFMKRAPLRDAFINVSNPTQTKSIVIVEGYATGLAVAQCLPDSRIVAGLFAAHLANIADVFRTNFRDAEIIIAADNDWHSVDERDANGKPKRNTGLESASVAAHAVGGLVVAPDMQDNKKTDWCDVRQKFGNDELIARFTAKLAEARSIPDDFIPKKRQDAPSAIKTGSISVVPESVDIVNHRCPDRFKKYYADRVTPQEIQPDISPYLVERDNGDIQIVFTRVGRETVDDEKRSGVFKSATTETVVSGVKAIQRGRRDNESYTTYANRREKRLRVSVPDSADARALAAALRSIGGVVAPKHLDFYRSAYLSQQYLEEVAYINVPGWHEINGNRIYIPPVGKCDLPGGLRAEFISSRVQRDNSKPAGTLEQYRQHVLALITGNPGLVFPVLLELAAVINPIRHGGLRAEGMTIVMYGQSGSGKSLSLRLAASVWGDHSVLVESANATFTALQNSAVDSSGGIMHVDDLSSMPDVNGKEAESLLYAIGNGRSKGRSSVDGKNLPVSEFSVICLITAEKSMTDTIQEKTQHHLKDGAKARLIEQPFIRVSDFKGCATLQEFASKLLVAFSDFYGTLGAAWVALLHKNGWQTIQREIKRYRDEFDTHMNELFPAEWSYRPDHKKRAHQIYAIAYAAGKMSQPLTGFTDQQVLETIIVCVEAEIESNDNGQRSETEAVECLWDFLTANTGNMGAIAREGNIAARQNRSAELMGWADVRESPDGTGVVTVFYLNQTQLKSASLKSCSMSGKEMLQLLTRHGYHEPPDTERGKLYGTKKIKVWVGKDASTPLDLIKISAPPSQD